MTDRTEATISKVETAFGPIYISVSHLYGNVESVTIFPPRKFENIALGEVLERITATANDTIAEIHAHWTRKGLPELRG